MLMLSLRVVVRLLVSYQTYARGEFAMARALHPPCAMLECWHGKTPGHPDVPTAYHPPPGGGRETLRGGRRNGLPRRGAKAGRCDYLLPGRGGRRPILAGPVYGADRARPHPEQELAQPQAHPAGAMAWLGEQR